MLKRQRKHMLQYSQIVQTDGIEWTPEESRCCYFWMKSLIFHI